MNYTHEQIIDVLKTIKEICQENTCKSCPFGVGSLCVLRSGNPLSWKLNETEKTIWRAFDYED